FIHQNELTSNVISAANLAIALKAERSGKEQNGWSVNLDTGSYATHYLARAATARFGLGAIIPADAVYASTMNDTSGNPLVGTNSYVIHFAPGQAPPVRGFWSITVYDENGFLVANQINRYSIGSESGLASNADGSIDILLQNSMPGGLESNWLPVPAGPFSLTFRLYWPDEAVLNGAWILPPVEPATAAAP
ncbi:MAG: DUF1214 domain-containing protein, partial [Acidobacteriia bacterium]|nr:DUF1214 domain-containing protein [Terriglobia bacterium]